MTSGGLLGVWGKWVKHAKYIYNIQDFNPEQVLAVGYTKSKFVTDAMMWFDKFSCKRSDLVITVGRDLVETVEKRFKGKKVPKTVMINNWIDENEIYPLEESNERVLAFKKKYALDGKFVIMYSGNIGLYYDLEKLIEVVERFKPGTKTADGREVVFAFVGAGSVLDKLVLYVKRASHVPPQPFMERPIDCKAGYKHHVTNEYLKHLQKSLMDLCNREFLHQVDLLSPSRTGVTEAEYWAQRRLDEKNGKLKGRIYTQSDKVSNAETAYPGCRCRCP